ncbi:MAG: cell division protein FtsA [Oligoflexia bacterium]|nr:cell division protein FtsA [Oligoflexia bacterium]
MGKNTDNLIVGLDFGTTKICAIVGKPHAKGIDIIGLGSKPSTGIRRGVIVNIDATVDAVKAAVEEAELMSGCEINSVYAGIAGGHINSFNNNGMISLKGEPITSKEVERVVNTASALNIGAERDVIHVIPQEYIIDGQRGIKDPVGMCGVRFEARVHIITGNTTSAQNIIRCANQCGLNVDDIVLEPIASSEAVLLDDEKELGVALLDIGGGTSDLTIFFEGSIVYSAVLAIGGNHITQDVAVGLRTPAIEAEKIKKQYGSALARKISRDDSIVVPGVGGRKPKKIPRNILAEIIEPRVEEILSLVGQEIHKSGYPDLLSSGIVITGGSSLLDGILELAEIIFDLPVRRGYPKGFGGVKNIISTPIYSTGVGLVLYGNKNSGSGKFRVRDKNIYDKVKVRMSDWYKELF